MRYEKKQSIKWHRNPSRGSTADLINWQKSKLKNPKDCPYGIFGTAKEQTKQAFDYMKFSLTWLRKKSNK